MASSSKQLQGLITIDTSELGGRIPACQEEAQRDLIMIIVGYSIKACLTKRCRWHYKRVIFTPLYKHTRKGNVLVGTSEFPLYKIVCSSWMMDFKHVLAMLIYSNDYSVLKTETIPSLDHTTPFHTSLDA